MGTNPSIICASLMSGPPENGFTQKMREVFTGGYWPLMPGPEFNENILLLAKTHKPNIIFLQIQADNILKPSVARQIAKDSFVIQFCGDIRHDTEPFYYDIGREIQLTLFTNMRDVNNCKRLGINAEWMEIGFDPARFRSWENIEITHDVVAHFNDYGSQFPNGELRRQIVTALKKEFGTKFDVWGNFPGAAGNLNHDQVEESKNYCRAKIAVNCSNFTEIRYSSDRLLRILGSKVMCLTHNFPEIESMYEPGKHLVVFDSIDDLVGKCHYYLKHDEERRQIAEAGQKHALENYTFEMMSNNILAFYYKYK